MKGPAGLVPVEEKDVKSYISRGYEVVKKKEKGDTEILARPLQPEADLDTNLDYDNDE